MAKKRKTDQPKRWVVSYSYHVEVEAKDLDEAYEKAGNQLDMEGRIKPQDLDCEGGFPAADYPTEEQLLARLTNLVTDFTTGGKLAPKEILALDRKLVQWANELMLNCAGNMEEGGLFAIVDDGNMDGDSFYYCPSSHVPYRDGMSLADIREAFHVKNLKDNYGVDSPDALDPEDLADAREQADGIAVAWVVTQEQLDQLSNGWPDVGNDSATYNANHTMKLMAQAMALKTIKEEEG